jgi:hypothetical protein
VDERLGNRISLASSEYPFPSFNILCVCHNFIIIVFFFFVLFILLFVNIEFIIIFFFSYFFLISGYSS